MNSPAAPYRGRFAPSPTGPLHFGSLVAALGSWLHARSHQGTWLIRIEDLDPPREVAGAADAQLRTLQGFGLASDEAVVRQSQRHEAYAEALAQLARQGDVFACRCSRRQLSASGGIHRACVAAPAPASGRTPAIRLRAPDAVVAFDDALRGRVQRHLLREDGDVILRRADGFWAYQLAVVVDDAAQRVSHVVRGADLLESTPRQIHLQRRLRVPTPRYAHLPLALDARGRKLGKSLAALAVDHEDPLPALRAAWLHLGQQPDRLPRSGSPRDLLRQAAGAFDLELVPRRDLECATAASASRPGPAH